MSSVTLCRLLLMGAAATSVTHLTGCSDTSARTRDDSSLKTWWHHGPEAEVNTDSQVAVGSVRQSRRYKVSVSIAGQNDYFDSFVYEAIPRNGRGRIYSPWDYPHKKNTLPDGVNDGISIELSIGLCMAWSSFLYTEDVDVKILRAGAEQIFDSGASEVKVKVLPSNIPYRLTTDSDGGTVIRVPYDPNGRRFSVEFQDDLYTFRSDEQKYAQRGHTVGEEPRHSLLIFASSLLSQDAKDLDYRRESDDVHTMTPGPINNGDWGASSILVFPPGVYWMNQDHESTSGKLGQMHMKLSPKTYWVHLEPGAYVKGAIEYTTHANKFYATGHGILSGEHYVYQANPTTYYQAKKSDQYSLRMWWHNDCVEGQTWHCVGPTLVAPPFNTMDFHGHSQISVRISDYKQVGAFFFQTDGPQMYPGSVVHHVFYHVNDDAIKTYYSDVTISNVTVWKCHNDPIIQMGWKARDVSNVNIDTLMVIHTRYIKDDMYVPSAIIGASPSYDGQGIVLPKSYIQMRIKNIFVEGRAPSLLRITPLQSYDLDISNVHFQDGLLENRIGTSIIKPEKGIEMNIGISNWTVKGERVHMENFHHDKLGRLNIHVSYWGQWRITQP